ncbi:MAG: endonuclease/exonuclease/phosphatase family protein [Nitrosomonadales bacterium]|nr:endonuclease/exonuclease/phosphatase family protein [Nitrosomonadales bacterium]
MKILFWNTQNKPLVSELTELILEEDCDVAAFCETTDATVLATVSALGAQHNKAYLFQATPGCERIRVVLKDGFEVVSLLNQHKYFSLMKLCSAGKELIVGFVHFPSKYSHSLDEVRRASELLHMQLQEEERTHGVIDSLIIGDFNVDPFEMPMISFSGLSATNSRDCFSKDVVTRADESKRLFYNPMWSLYSLHAERPGSHKYRRLGEDVISWHFLDQVIIRPSLIDKFDFNALKLISNTTNYSFANRNGKPSLSDHLPIACEIGL